MTAPLGQVALPLVGDGSAPAPGHTAGESDGLCVTGSGDIMALHRRGASSMIKYVYSIDYPLGKKREYVDWVRSIADILQEPDELKGLASYDNVFSASPQRVVEFSFESMRDAATYFERPEMIRIFGAELPQHGTNVGITALRRLTDYTKDSGGA